MLVVDTGPILALADETDRHHEATRELLEDNPGPLVTTPMVIAEAAYLINKKLGAKAETALYQDILDEVFEVRNLDMGDWVRIRQLVEKYSDLPLGGTDASVIALAERLCVTDVATLDHRHFRVVVPLHATAFVLLP